MPFFFSSVWVCNLSSTHSAPHTRRTSSTAFLASLLFFCSVTFFFFLNLLSHSSTSFFFLICLRLTWSLQRAYAARSSFRGAFFLPVLVWGSLLWVLLALAESVESACGSNYAHIAGMMWKWWNSSSSQLHRDSRGHVPYSRSLCAFSGTAALPPAAMQLRWARCHSTRLAKPPAGVEPHVSTLSRESSFQVDDNDDADVDMIARSTPGCNTGCGVPPVRRGMPEHLRAGALILLWWTSCCKHWPSRAALFSSLAGLSDESRRGAHEEVCIFGTNEERSSVSLAFLFFFL